MAWLYISYDGGAVNGEKGRWECGGVGGEERKTGCYVK